MAERECHALSNFCSKPTSPGTLAPPRFVPVRTWDVSPSICNQGAVFSSARQQRLAWLTRQYTSGRLLVAFGFDSLHLGRQKLFKGMRFASTDQASVIWFGSTGAEYAPANAMFSDKNLITAKPLVGVDDAIKLLQRSIKSK
jgi:hypothetical protein